MNDKDRDLIQQILQTAGQTGEKGFGYLVHFRFVDGLTDFIGGVAFVTLTLWVIRTAWNSKKFEEWDDGAVCRGIITIICSIVFFISGWVALGGVTAMLAPEGAAIHTALHDIGGSK
jgi:hypothetical protein